MYDPNSDFYAETLHFPDNPPLNRSDFSGDHTHFFWHHTFCFLQRAPGEGFPVFPAFAEFAHGFFPDAPVTALNPFFCFPIHRRLSGLRIPIALSAAPLRHFLLPVASALFQGFVWTYLPLLYFFQNQIASAVLVHAHP